VSLRPKVEAHAELTTALAEEAVDAGEKDLAIELFRWGETLRQWAAGRRALTGVNGNRKVKVDMEAAHRQKLADAHSGKKLHPNLLAARAANLATMADLAKALGYSKAMLSRIMSGDRSMPDERAALFKRLTGKDWR